MRDWRKKKKRRGQGLEPTGFFLLLYNFSFGRYPHHHHITTLWHEKSPNNGLYHCLGARYVFYENLYYLLIFSFFLGFNTYKRQWCRLGLKEMAGDPRCKCILSPDPHFFFFHLDYTNLNGYLQTVDMYSHHHHWSIRSSHRSTRKQ